MLGGTTFQNCSKPSAEIGWRCLTKPRGRNMIGGFWLRPDRRARAPQSGVWRLAKGRERLSGLTPRKQRGTTFAPVIKVAYPSRRVVDKFGPVRLTDFI